MKYKIKFSTKVKSNAADTLRAKQKCGRNLLLVSTNLKMVSAAKTLLTIYKLDESMTGEKVF